MANADMIKVAITGILRSAILSKQSMLSRRQTAKMVDRPVMKEKKRKEKKRKEKKRKEKKRKEKKRKEKEKKRKEKKRKEKEIRSKSPRPSRKRQRNSAQLPYFQEVRWSRNVLQSEQKARAGSTIICTTQGAETSQRGATYEILRHAALQSKKETNAFTPKPIIKPKDRMYIM